MKGVSAAVITCLGGLRFH